MRKLLLIFFSLFTFMSFGQALFEDFEGTATVDASGNWPLTSGNWLVFDNGIGGTSSTLKWGPTTFGSFVCNDNRAATVNRENVTDGTFAEDWLVTPQVTVPTNGQVRFYTKSSSAGEQMAGFPQYNVYISTASQNNPADFTLLQSYDELAITNSSCDQKFVLLDAYAGMPVYIAFVMRNDNGDRWNIDNVTVDEQCLAPTALTATPLATSATLSWTYTGPATQFEIEYGPVGFVPGTGTIVSPVSNNYVLSPLTPLTNYTYYVRALCASDNISPWSAFTNFATTAAPPECGGNFIDSGGVSANYSNNEDITVTICPTNPGDLVTVTFTSFNTEARWDALYVYDGNSIASPLLDSGLGTGLGPNAGISGGYWGTAIPGPFEASSASGCLTFRFRSDGSGTRAGWTANVTCAPPPTCPKPSNVLISGITENSAIVSWTENGPATAWEVNVQPAAAPVPTPATPGWIPASGTPSVLYPGLNSGTLYKAYVRAICNPGVDESDVSVPANFATLISNDECATAIVVPVNDDTSCSNTVSGTVLGATASTDGNTCGGTDDDDVWFQFTATESTHFVTLTNVAGSTTDLYHVLYSGSCGTLTQMYCSDNDSSTASGLVPGQTYYIRVYTFTATPNQTTTFEVCIGTPVNCEDASAFCGDTGLVYPNSTGAPSYGSIDCLFTTPNPAWYFMQVSQAGSLQFQIAQTSTATGNGLDVDYVIWGPFTPAEFATSCNDLYDFPDGNTTIPNNVASCSYSAAAIENFTIPNANLDDIYVVLITNYSNQPGTVTFTQTGGTGATNCDIVCSNDLGPDQVLCNQSTYTIVASNATADSYEWYYNGGLIPGVSTSSITVSQSGVYECVITCGINSVSTEVEITFNTSTDVVFASLPTSICQGDVVPVLPTTSDGAVIGTWNPAVIDNMTSGQYIFTPDANQCANPYTLNVTVNQPVVPSFTNPGPLCMGAPTVALNGTSGNGITGDWTLGGSSVTNVDTSTAGIFTYTFTPNPATQCASVLTMDVEITSTCTFGTIASAVMLEDCQTAVNGDYFSTTSGSQTIGSGSNIFTNNDLGVFVENSGNLNLKGAEVRTFKSVNSNICSVRMYYNVHEASVAAGTFTPINLINTDNCTSGTYPVDGGVCSPGDQRWYDVSNTFDLTLLTPGDYVIEVYYDISGDNVDPMSTTCPDNLVLNNGGMNYSAAFKIQAAPTVSHMDPTICNATNGSITISDLIAGEIYEVTYLDDTVVVGPTNYTANINGEILISGLDAGSYTNFDLVINGCSTTIDGPIVLVNPVVTPTFNPIGPFCVGDVITMPTTSIEGINGTFPAVDSSMAGTYTVSFTPTGGQCGDNLGTLTVVINDTPVLNSVSQDPICYGNDAVFTISATPNTSIRYRINGGTTQVDTVDATGVLTVTVPMPPVGNVILTVLDVDNGACATTINMDYTITVNPIPVAVFDLNYSDSICAGQNAVFGITGTPNATITYQVDGGSDMFATLDATGVSGPIVAVSGVSSNVIVTISNVNDGLCSDTLSDTFEITVNALPVPMITPTDATCGNDDGVILITQPLTNGPGIQADLFISEVYDSEAGGLSYIELYNGTGTTVDLSNYKLKVYTSTNPAAIPYTAVLSGMLLDNDVVVVKFVASAADQGGVVPDLTFPGGGFNGNDRVVLTSSSDVEIDSWGVLGTAYFTPTNAGFSYRRNVTAVHPSLTWDVNDWTVLDPEDPSDVGSYSFYSELYEYSVDNGGSYQSGNNFPDLAAGTYNVIVHDLITGCYSLPVEVILSTTGGTPAVVAFSYITPVCILDSTNPLPDTSIAGFNTSGTFTVTSANVADITINGTTGEIDLAGTLAGTYTVNYAVAEDVANCITANDFSFDITINAATAAIVDFSYTTPVCVLDTTNPLPDTSVVGFNTSGTFTVTSTNAADITINGTTGEIDLAGTLAGTYTVNYAVAEDAANCIAANDFSFNITINDAVTPIFDDIEVCAGSNEELPTVSTNGYSGNWTTSLDTSLIGSTTYTFNPDDSCANQGTIIVTVIGCDIQKGISPNGDEYNEYFDLSAFNVSRLEIFNRYGRKVYGKSNYTNEWNGKADNGNELPDGTYYYVIEFRDRASKTGWIYINREH